MINPKRIIGEEKTTILLRPDELNLLKHKAPYLISMAVSDITLLTKSDFKFLDREKNIIPEPKKWAYYWCDRHNVWRKCLFFQSG